MNGFERRREQKKESILNAAWELFIQFGYNKVSIAEIAKKASVSQVSIYNFFNSKENLYFELLNRILDKYYQELFQIMESSDTIKLKFEKLLTARINFFESFSMRLLLDNGNFKENILKDNYTKFSEAFLKLFEDGKKEGILDNSLSPETILTLFEMFEYYFINNPKAVAVFINNPHFAKDFLTFLFNALSKK